MKVHKIEIIVCDPNDNLDTLEDIKDEICANDLLIHFIKTESKEFGEWKDNTPLNFTPTRAKNYFNKL